MLGMEKRNGLPLFLKARSLSVAIMMVLTSFFILISFEDAGSVDLGDMVVHYRFNEGSGQVLADSSGNGWDARMGLDEQEDERDPRWGQGVNGTCLDFDGVEDLIICNPFDMPDSEFTIAFWIKIADDDFRNHVLSYAVPGEDNEVLIYIDGYITIEVDWPQDFTVVKDIRDGDWHHLAFTWRSSDGNIVLYVDGVEEDSGTVSTGESIEQGGSLVLGYEQDSVGGGFESGQGFVGSLDEVLILETYLNSSNIGELYNNYQLPITGFEITSGSGFLDLSWDDVNDPDLDHYNVYGVDSSKVNNGLLGAYYNNENLTDLVGYRNDEEIDFDWEVGSPLLGVDINSFSVSWNGYLKIDRDGDHEIFTQSDDGVRLWLDGDLIIDDWRNHGVTENRGIKTLIKGYHQIRLDYFEHSLSAVVSLEIDSPGEPRMTIPSSQLFNFNLTDMELIGTSSSSNFRDSDLETGKHYFYQVSYIRSDGGMGSFTDVEGGSPSITTMLSLYPYEVDATVGEEIVLGLKLRNDAFIEDWFDLSAEDPYSSWVIFGKDELYIGPGEYEYIDVSIIIPLDADSGTVQIDLLIYSELNDINQIISAYISITTDPVILDLRPNNGDNFGTTNMMFTWRTAIETTSLVHIREEGESEYDIFNGTDDREHIVNITDLDRDTTYEFYVESTSPYGSSQSEVREITIGTGVIFKHRIHHQRIDRDYDQEVLIYVENIDDKVHQIKVTVDNPHDDLIVGFIGTGSNDKVMSTLPGNSYYLKLAIHAQDAKDIDHNLVLNLTTIPEDGEEPLKDYSIMRVNLDHVFVNLTVTEVSMDPYTLEKRIRIENIDDTITDLKVYPEDKYASYLNNDPVVNHGLLYGGDVLEIGISPQLFFSFTPFTCRVFISGYDKVFHIDLDFSPPPEWEIFSASIFPNWGGNPFVEIPPDDMDIDGFKDDVDDDIDGDGIPNKEEPLFMLDTDNDGYANSIEYDDDGDGNPDSSDPWRIDFDNDWYPNHVDPDRDGDGIENENDTYPDDLDNDGIPNGPDIDDDNDKIKDGDDYHPQDHDNDGENDGQDNDDDNDGIEDSVDTYPYDEDNDGTPDADDSDWKDGSKADPKSNTWNPNPAPGGSPGNFGGGGGSDSAGGDDWYCTNKPELDLAELLVFLVELGLIFVGLITGIAAAGATAACMWGLLGIVGGFIKDAAIGAASSAAENFFGFSTHDMKVGAARWAINTFSRGSDNDIMGSTRGPEDAYRYRDVTPETTRGNPLTVINSKGVHYVWQEKVNGVSQIFYAQSDSPIKNPKEEVMVTNSSIDSVDPYLHSNGGMFLVYAENGPSSSEVLIRQMESDGTWGKPYSVATSTGMVHEPRYDRDNDGLFHVVWSDSRYGNYEIMHTYTISYMYSFHLPERITNTDGHSLQPAIVVDASDRSHIVWSDSDGMSREIYHVRSNDRGNSWGSIEVISSSGTRASEPTMVLTRLGTIHVAWSDHRHDETEIYYSKSFDLGDSWEDEVRITDDDSYSELPELNYYDENLILLWHDDRTNLDLRYFKTYNSSSDEWSLMKRMPSGIPTIDSLFFEIQLTPDGDEGDVKPHDLYLYLDDILLGSIKNEVPEGKYIFEIPLDVLSAAAYQMKEGKLKLKSKHMNPGHYVVAANWKLTWHYTYDDTYLSAPDQYTADMYLRENMSDHWLTEDPAIYANDISLSDRLPEVDDVVDISATIRNQGGISATGINVRFYEQEPGNASRLIGEQTVKAIGSHESVTVIMKWNATRYTTRIYVVVDEAGLVNELIEDNNIAFMRLNVVVMEPPVGTISINEGDPYTGETRIFISFNSESANEVTHYSLSNDNSTWSDWKELLDYVSWYLEGITRTTGDSGVERTVYAKFKDIAGLESEVYSSTIEYYPDAPVVVKTSMDDGEVGVESSISIEFSNPMDDAATRSAFSIEPKVDGSFTWVNSTLYFIPTDGWTADETYKISIFHAAGDFSGRELETDHNWTFVAKEGIVDDDDPPPVDSDGDGMPDAWEDLHGLNKTDPSDATLDLDGDGISNVDEFKGGTNPEQIDAKDDDDGNDGDNDSGGSVWWIIPILILILIVIIIGVVVFIKLNRKDDLEE